MNVVFKGCCNILSCVLWINWCMRANTIVTVIVSITRYAETAGGLSDAGEELDVGGRKIYGCRTSWNLGTAPARGLEPSAKSPPSRINFLDDLTPSAIHTTLSQPHREEDIVVA